MDDATAIRAVLDRQEAAWAAGDAAGFARDTTHTVAFTNVVGMFSVGRAPFEAQHAHIFATFYKGSTMRHLAVENLAFVRPDVAVVNTLTQVTGFGQMPPDFPVHGETIQARLEQVMVRDGDAWRVAAFHNVTVLPNARVAAPGDPS